PGPSKSRSVLTEELSARKATDVARWSDAENLATQWDGRAKLAAELIGAGPLRILDIGAGAMALRHFLAPDCDYVPADVVKRCDDCLVVDLNSHEFPAGDYDYVSFLGVLEYVHDVDWALAVAATSARNLIATYCTDASGDRAYRRGMGWVNDYTCDEFDALLRDAGWSVKDRVEYKRGPTNIQYMWQCSRAT
ncbi:MAG: hypothetical protein ABI655_15590, partial [Phenylobacterium sp.]